MTSSDTLKRTPLYAAHLEWGAKMVAFGGWEMPVQYTGIVEEHLAVRQHVGLFDISHMGEIAVAGPNAEAVLNRLLTNDLRKIAVGQAQYTLLCNEHGGVLDDLLVYRLAPTVFLLITNAANTETDLAWITDHATAPVVIENESDQTAALALQGPAAAQVLTEAASITQFRIADRTLFGRKCRVARTGYTGEDGFEILCAPADAPRLWTELLARGATCGIKPVGLGARDTLRLEMCYPLHGNELTGETTPLEAGLSRFVAFDKGDFIGRAALAEQQAAGVAQKLVAFKLTEKSPPPRPHYPIRAGGRTVGEVTSGTQSPSLGIGIGLGYVPTAAATVGARLEIEVRGKTYPAVIEQKPLLKRGK